MIRTKKGDRSSKKGRGDAGYRRVGGREGKLEMQGGRDIGDSTGRDSEGTHAEDRT